jgi:hypothetical protein
VNNVNKIRTSVKKRDQLSYFDRGGIVIVAFLGALIAWIIASANHGVLNAPFAMICPGWVMAIGLARFSSSGHVPGIAAALGNGVIYGLLLYSWDRLANFVSDRLRKSWFKLIPGSGRFMT